MDVDELKRIVFTPVWTSRQGSSTLACQEASGSDSQARISEIAAV